jgi:acyl-CoA reductase-like NAD-dependent aldehyde dehydrogenase
MEKSKETSEKAENIKPATGEFMAELTQATERIIAEAGEKAGREAEQELERVLGEYERKTKQIILKIKEDTKAKTAEITAKLSEAIMFSIEQASAKAVNSMVSELSIRAGELTRKMQETTEKEPNQEISKASTGLWDNIENTYKSASQEGLDVVEAKKEDAGKEAEPVMEEGEIKLNQSIESEDFDQWLTH